METHYKTGIVMFCFFLTTIGWWAWQGFLSGSYAPTPSIYAVRDGFSKTFGPDPMWWATVFAVLGVLGLLDFTRKLAKRTLIGLNVWRWPPWKPRVAGELEVEVWQEMEMDPVIWKKLQRLAAGHGDEDPEHEEP